MKNIVHSLEKSLNKKLVIFDTNKKKQRIVVFFSSHWLCVNAKISIKKIEKKKDIKCTFSLILFELEAKDFDLWKIVFYRMERVVICV